MLVGGMDPSGGAGLPADIRSSAAMGVHGCPVVSALTVQDSARVLSWEPVGPEMLAAQMRSVVEDGPVSAVKTGMLGSTDNIVTVADFIRERLPGTIFVMDPVTASGAGTSLAQEDAVRCMSDHLIPLATLVTPNTSEASLLAGIGPVDSLDAMEEAGRIILDMGAGAVLVKGGHLTGDPCDVLVTSCGSSVLTGTRITEDTVHGTGCTLASACASLLSLGFPLEDAVRAARDFVEKSIYRRMGRRHGYLPGHFPGTSPSAGPGDETSFYLPPAHCTVCGGHMERDPGAEGHLHCSMCGYVHYRNPLPAVALLLRQGDSVLLVRRAVPPGRGRLCLPGGFMELGEDPMQCGSRELREETGLEIEEAGMFSIETDTTAYGSILLIALEVRRWRGDPRPGDDASEIVWAPLENMPDLAFRAHERLIRALGEGTRQGPCGQKN